MLSRQQAEALAQGILEAAKAEADEQRERTARGAPIGLRLPEIKALPKRVQDSLVRESLDAARSSVSVRFVGALWILACVIGWSWAHRHYPDAKFLAMGLLPVGISAILILAARRILRRMAEELRSSQD